MTSDSPPSWRWQRGRRKRSTKRQASKNSESCEMSVSMDLVKALPVRVPATGNAASLPVLVERAGGAARFAWDEFFYAEHHNPHTQKAYMAAAKRFLAWAELAGGGGG